MSNTRSYPNTSRVVNVALISLVIAAVLVGITLLLPNPVTPFIAKFFTSLASGLAITCVAMSIAFHEKD